MGAVFAALRLGSPSFLMNTFDRMMESKTTYSFYHKFICHTSLNHHTDLLVLLIPSEWHSRVMVSASRGQVTSIIECTCYRQCEDTKECMHGSDTRPIDSLTPTVHPRLHSRFPAFQNS